MDGYSLLEFPCMCTVLHHDSVPGFQDPIMEKALEIWVTGRKREREKQRQTQRERICVCRNSVGKKG